MAENKKPIFTKEDMEQAYNMGKNDLKEYEFRSWMFERVKNGKK